MKLNGAGRQLRPPLAVRPPLALRLSLPSPESRPSRSLSSLSPPLPSSNPSTRRQAAAANCTTRTHGGWRRSTTPRSSKAPLAPTNPDWGLDNGRWPQATVTRRCPDRMVRLSWPHKDWFAGSFPSELLGQPRNPNGWDSPTFLVCLASKFHREARRQRKPRVVLMCTIHSCAEH